MSAFIFGNLSIRKENRAAASLRFSSDLLTFPQRNLNDELNSHAAGKQKHNSQSCDICKKQETAIDISDVCPKGPYNAESSTGPSRLNALRMAVGQANLSKEPKYSHAGRAYKEKYARLRERQKERLSRSRNILTEPSTSRTSQVPRVPGARSLGPRQLLLESHTHSELLLRIEAGGTALRKQQQTWSDEELDSLWVGVRRHGLPNWEAMLRDPRLKFSRFRTAADLEARWNLQDLHSDFPCLNGR